MKVGSKGLVCCFPQAMSGQVERDGQVFVLLNGRLEPLLTVLGELVVCEEWNGKGDVGFWRSKVGCGIQRRVLRSWR